MKIFALVVLNWSLNGVALLLEINDACGIKGVCDCFDEFDPYDNMTKFHVECPNRSLTRIPRNIPSNVSEMGLSENKIGEFATEDFPNLLKLRILELSRNNIRRLPSKGFRKLSNLHTLNLDHNKIENLAECSFCGLGNLSFLNLVQNKIQSLPMDIFRPLQNLCVLYLSGNSLAALPRNSFDGLMNLKELQLNNNVIKVLQSGSFWGLPGLEELVLNENKITEVHDDVFENDSSIDVIDLSCNSIERLFPACFRGLATLKRLNLSMNHLSRISKDVFTFTPRLLVLILSHNRLNDVPDGLFHKMDNLRNLYFRENKITVFPNLLLRVSRALFEIDFSGNLIHNFSSTPFGSVKIAERLYLSRNKISRLQKDIFQDVYLGEVLDLSDNVLGEIPPGLFSRGKPHGLKLLLLHRNSITYIAKNALRGLENLQVVCLFNNKIQTLAEGSLFGRNLKAIYMFQNNLTKIDGDPFGSSDVSEIHLYGNKIETLSEKVLLRLKNDSLLYVSCEFLTMLPRYSNHELIKCVSPSSLPSVAITFYGMFIYNEFETGGFNCTSSQKCVPCGKGTFGDRKTVGCHDCPKGGFYQDEVGQRASHPGGMSCKHCNDGTYVKEGHGQSIQECEVCPEGTNQTIEAGLRACFCKNGYARTDRYGPCSICLEESLDCSQDYKLLRPGYFWSWNFSAANLSNYQKFVENLQKEERNLTLYVDYIEEIPRAFPCQRTKSCPNSNGVIAGQCADGYQGWLCSNCEPEYYSVLNTCVSCPKKEVLILEIAAFLIVCILICYLVSWQIKRDVKRHAKQRFLVDVVISRVKILLGFYQVVGEIFASLHEINWTGPLVLIGTFISSLELNILRIFVRPRCFSEKLVINPQTEFIIGVSCPFVIIALSFVLYQTRKLHLKCKSLVNRVPYFPVHLHNFKLRLYTCVIVLMFLMYPPICSVIFELYPKACKTFYLDKDGNHSVTRLRSDLDVDCEGLIAYHYFAYFFTVSYVIAFPTVLFFLLWKYCSGSYQKRLTVENINSVESDNVTTEEDSLVENITTSSPSVPVWLNFLRENYKHQFWYWEIIELARKVTQTLLITLFGWEDRLTVLLTTCISVLFLLLHARYRPMKSSHEQRLQMLSLTVIFINVVIASNEVSSSYDDTVTIILILLNILMLLIIAGEIIITFVRHLKHMNVTKRAVLALMVLQRYFQRRR